MPLKVGFNVPICTLNRTKETKGITECLRALAICVAAVKLQIQCTGTAAQPLSLTLVCMPLHRTSNNVQHNMHGQYIELTVTGNEYQNGPPLASVRIQR